MPSTADRGRQVALLFPGQGVQHTRMAAGLYGHSAVFTGVMDTAFGLLGAQGAVVRADWLAGGSAEMLDDVTRAQPLLYAIGYALASMVQSWGVEPAALLGHSVGEMVAATVAGVFDFADGMRLMRDRIKIFADTPDGGMMAVAAAPEEAARYLFGQVAIAAVNGPRQLLLAGPAGELAEVRRRLQADQITSRPAKARQAFHSPVVAQAAAQSVSGWEQTPLRPPARTLYSAYLGRILTAADACDPRFWARQPAMPVLFGATLDRMLADGDFLLVEAGPGQGLSALARRHRAVSSGRSEVLPLLPAEGGGAADDRRAVQQAADQIQSVAGPLAQLPFDQSSSASCQLRD